MLDVQRRLAAQILKCGENRVRFDPENLGEIKETITKSDIRGLIGRGIISKRRVLNTSRFWSRKKKRHKGPGSRKGKKTARTEPKRAWISKVRLQRSYLKHLRGSGPLSNAAYRELYMKSKGGFFRSLRHLKFYIEEKGLKK